ncbi:Cilia/flagella-associated protein 20/WDR90/C3orf67 [Cinara cedri]|uniref:Cilia/flagella-associated protein 20/WDR90/C3orf67 n=1 Tax=Cinara cedri TaxID=506608 RepID=A0A5E4NSU3_9HEMI|nr:Cilia/flagella-associated protein 20/WDR90/C3orf67 [Cinara cedri]
MDELIQSFASLKARKCTNGELRIIQDEILKSNVLELQSQNVAACLITTPADPKGSLGIVKPFITLLLKNLNRYFTFEITVLDDENIRRRIRVSNYQSATRMSTFMCSIPLCLSEDWSQVQFNLADFTNRTFNTNYKETVRVQVHANCRLRRVYFSDEQYNDDQLPNDYRMYRTKMIREKPKKGVIPKKKGGAKKND